MLPFHWVVNLDDTSYQCHDVKGKTIIINKHDVDVVGSLLLRSDFKRNNHMITIDETQQMNFNEYFSINWYKPMSE